MKTLLYTAALLSGFQTQADNWKKFNTSNSELSSNIINTVAIKENTLWIGNEHGTASLNLSDSSYDSIQNNGPEINTSTFLFPSNGEVWAGTDEGIAQFDGHSWNVLTSQNSGLPLNVIRCMFTDHMGNTWIGTWGGGLAKLSNTWETFSTFNSNLVSNGITSITEDKQGRIWIGTFNRGISIYDHGTWITLNTDNSMLPANEINSLYADGNSVWIGTSHGIAKFYNGQMTKFTTANTGIVFNQVNCFIREGNDLWIGSDGGLLRYDGLGLIAYNTANSGLPQNDVVSIAVDPNGNKWIGTSGGGLVEFNQNGIPAEINEISNPLAQIYPNPCVNELIINNMENDDLQLQLFNLHGQSIRTISVSPSQSIQLSTADLPCGVYICEYISNHKSAKFKLIKTN